MLVWGCIFAGASDISLTKNIAGSIAQFNIWVKILDKVRPLCGKCESRCFSSRPIQDVRMSEILQLNPSEDPPRREGLVKEGIKGTALTWESNQTYLLPSLPSCVLLHLFNQDELLIDILTLGESLSITRVHLNKSKPSQNWRRFH